MKNFSLILDGFSIPAAQKAEETTIVLAQALNSSPDHIKQLLQSGSGILLESDQLDEIEDLANIAQSLGLNCSITKNKNLSTEDSFLRFETSEASQETQPVIPPEVRSKADALPQQSDGISFNVDELENNLESEAPKPDSSLDLSSSKTNISQQEIEPESTDQPQENADYNDTETESDEQLSTNAISKDELEWGQTDALSFVKKSKRTERLVDIATASIIAFLTSLLFFFFNNQSDYEQKMRDLQKYAESLVKMQEAEDRQIQEALVQPDPDVIPSTLEMVGREKNPNWEAEINIYSAENEIKSINITITTPPPPHLTDDEIVNQVPRKPWLSRVVVSDLSIKQREDLKFIATGKARAFIESHDGKRIPSLAEVVMTGEILESKAEVSARLMINRGYDQIPLGDQATIEPISEDDFKYFVAIPVSAKYIPPKK